MAEIRFSSVKDAVRWSEEVALSSGIQSSMQMWLSSGGSSVPMSEVNSVAQTICSLTANCKPFGGIALKAVYSPMTSREEDRDLSIFIANTVQHESDCTGITIGQLIDIGLWVIARRRKKEMYDQKHPMRLLAESIGVCRETLYRSEQLSKIIREAESAIQVIIGNAEIEMISELSVREWI